MMNTDYRVHLVDGASTTTMQASADLSDQAGRCVTDSSGKIAVASSATADMVGILHEAASSATDAACTVVTSGITYGHAGGTIGEMDLLTTDSSGDVVATTTKGDYVIGHALEDASSGDFIKIQVIHSRIGTYS